MEFDKQVERRLDSLTENRDHFERDRGRVVHSFSFRRLQGKMQVLGLNESDFHRTRLTHSLEVSQLGRGIISYLTATERDEKVRSLLPSQDLIEAVCLAHDLGHPPFGHAGEIAINSCLLHLGEKVGFEGNGHTLRLLADLEPKFEHRGLDLTRRTLLGILKYPTSFETLQAENSKLPKSVRTGKSPRVSTKKKFTFMRPPKCYMDTEHEVVDWILSPFSKHDRKTFTAPILNEDGSEYVAKYKSFDCSIMDVADEVAYAVHDLDDAVYLGLIIKGRNLTLEEIEHLTDLGSKLSITQSTIEGLFDRFSRVRQDSCSKIIRAMIENGHIVKLNLFESDLLDYQYKLSNEAAGFIDFLNDEIVKKKVVRAPSVRALEIKSQEIIRELFMYLAENGESVMPPHGAGFRFRNEAKTASDKLRHITDYVAGMTDRFCSNWYRRAFLPDEGNILDRL